MRPPPDGYVSSFNSMELRFHATPVPDAALTRVLKSLNALPGCVVYRLEVRSYRRYCWKIIGVWESDHAKKAHYHSADLQTLLTLLQASGLAEIRFSEANSGCLSNDFTFKESRLAG